MKLKDKLMLLSEVKGQIESEAFQTFIVKPMWEEMDKLKVAYDCESLRELSTIKGKKQGLQFLIGILKGIDLEIKNTRYELENSEEGR